MFVIRERFYAHPVYVMRFKIIVRVKWVPVTTSWRVLRLRIEERPLIWRVGANILNK